MHAVTPTQLRERRAGVMLVEDRADRVSVNRDFRIGFPFRPLGLRTHGVN
jgi:hypothetical protein